MPRVADDERIDVHGHAGAREAELGRRKPRKYHRTEPNLCVPTHISSCTRSTSTAADSKAAMTWSFRGYPRSQVPK